MNVKTLQLLTNSDKLVIAMLEHNIGSISPAQSATLGLIISEIRALQRKPGLSPEIQELFDTYREALLVVHSVSTLHQIGVITTLGKLIGEQKETPRED